MINLGKFKAEVDDTLTESLFSLRLQLSFFVFSDGEVLGEISKPSTTTFPRLIDYTGIKTMQQLLFAVVLSEVVVIMALSFKTPIRKLLIMGLDRTKRGRGPVVIQTVSATVCILLVASVYNMMSIQKRWIEDGALNPTDEVIMAKHLLESTLMGKLFTCPLRIRFHQF